MTSKDIPSSSLIHRFISYMKVTEVPFSYQLVGGLSAIGAVLRRNRWINQVDWKIYPNQPVMFIGPSGIGKDTIINRVGRCVSKVEKLSKVPSLGGTTIESLYYQLNRLNPQACAFIPIPEITAFFGKANYQANILTGITNLLSNGDKVDVSTKGEIKDEDGNPIVIEQPTLTIHAGSTVEWLHSGMPAGTLEGGFLGRFLIMVEKIGDKFVPLVKGDKTPEELEHLEYMLALWNDGLAEAVDTCSTPREVLLSTEAQQLYANFYYNRFKWFSKAVMPYANRSRDTVLRLAMLMAISRGNYSWIEEEDVEFAVKLIREVAERIDAVVLPPSRDAQIADKVLAILPASQGEIYRQMARRFSVKDVDMAMELLRRTSQIEWAKDGTISQVSKR